MVIININNGIIMSLCYHMVIININKDIMIITMAIININNIIKSSLWLL